MSPRLFLVFLSLVLATPTFASDTKATSKKVISEWKKWMKKHRIKRGSIIVSYNGEEVGEGGIKRSVDDPAKVASLSKSITAVCALRALDAAEKKASAPLSEVMPAALNKHAPKDERFSRITVGQLITHTSGIHSTYHRKQLSKLRTLTKENKLWQFSKFSREKLGGSPGQGPYVYSNANYLALGLVIEELTGEPYEEFCKKAVLEPAGVTTASLNKKWRVMSSWGGWEISARDYMKFAQANFSEKSNPSASGDHQLPNAYGKRNRKYGPGVIYRFDKGGFNIWHSGSWRGIRGGPKDRFGAYFAKYKNGYTIVTNYAHDAWDRKISGELDSLLYNSTHK